MSKLQIGDKFTFKVERTTGPIVTKTIDGQLYHCQPFQVDTYNLTIVEDKKYSLTEVFDKFDEGDWNTALIGVETKFHCSNDILGRRFIRCMEITKEELLNKELLQQYLDEHGIWLRVRNHFYAYPDFDRNQE